MDRNPDESNDGTSTVKELSFEGADHGKATRTARADRQEGWPQEIQPGHRNEYRRWEANAETLTGINVPVPDATELSLVGIGATLTLLIVDKTISVVKRRRNGNNNGEANTLSYRVGSRIFDQIARIGSTIEHTETQVTELRTLHEARDADGTPLVYMPRSIVKTLIKLNDLIDQQTRVLQQIEARLSALERASS